jgi:multiple sugar transport system ATP-binding protein
MAEVTLKNIWKRYTEDTAAVRDFNLDIADKEFVVLVGPSGCGKSTTLRMIAGLEEITEGELFIEDRLINNVQPKDRNIAMVFQNYALYPHMTVFENIAFGLKLRKMPKDEIHNRVLEAARILDIEEYLQRKPKALSGGQRQRVALGRAMVRNPAVFLLDEPLSNLDAKLRTSMRSELIKLHKRLQTTFVYVTHDQTEAMTMGDRLVVMKDGVIQQVDTPQNLYERPCNQFVAGFIGSPQMNFMDGKLGRDAHGYYVDIDGDRLYVRDGYAGDGCPGDERSNDARQDDERTGGESTGHSGIAASGIPDALQPYEGKRVALGVRPEDFLLAQSGAMMTDADGDLREYPVIDTKIEVRELMGAECYLYVNYKGYQLIARIPTAGAAEAVDQVKLYIRKKKTYLFDAETGDAIG